MRCKKFLAWLVVFFGYIACLHIFSSPVSESVSAGMKRVFHPSGGEIIPIGEALEVKIIRTPRAYLFGLLKLPAYVFGYNIDLLNQVFLALMLFLLLVFILMEIRGRKYGMEKVDEVLPDMGRG